MVVTVILLRTFWCLWRKREDERRVIAALNRRELQDIGLTEVERQALLETTLLQALLAQYRRHAAELQARRARTQRAVDRLSRRRAARSDDYPWANAA